jgi:hypothetical protein
MAKINRYLNAPRLNNGKSFGTTEMARKVWNAVESGNVEFVFHKMQENERLDILAGQIYGEGRNWWIIAAASGIGWGLQVPPGTILRIPTSLDFIRELGG